jgi:Na+/pantothenate symporter
LAFSAYRLTPRNTIGISLWNAFGSLDLIVALTLAVLSTEGTPLRLFKGGPGTAAMTDLPWVMIPTVLVPIYLLIHLAIANRLWVDSYRLRVVAAQ